METDGDWPKYLDQEDLVSEEFGLQMAHHDVVTYRMFVDTYVKELDDYIHGGVLSVIGVIITDLAHLAAYNNISVREAAETSGASLYNPFHSAIIDLASWYKQSMLGPDGEAEV